MPCTYRDPVSVLKSRNKGKRKCVRAVNDPQASVEFVVLFISVGIRDAMPEMTLFCCAYG